MLTRRLDSLEFAAHQLEQAICTLVALGNESTINQLSALHAQVLAEYEPEYAGHVAQAIEHIMEAIRVDQ